VASPTVLPEHGQAVVVRGRPASVQAVRPHANGGPTVHLVDVEYLDGWDFPADDTVLWEVEVGARVLPGGGLPRVGAGSLRPDALDRFGAFCDALRWSSIARLPGLTADDAALISPWESAVHPEPYQLVPVLKALQMPRVSLLLADDVGLGKTIEAGLVLRELLARRRIRRVLVVCPASLQAQWRDELSQKFALDFTVVDRHAVTDVQREYGMDANPWAVIPRAITSMDFLRQPDVLHGFLAAAQRLERGHALALDLLVVDEAHNLAPLGFTERSQRSRMLAEVAPHAEHRLFLSATPHNGFTSSFSGLLELLDPVRFRQTSDLSSAEHSQVELVMVRRMKSELNARARERGETPPFTRRRVERIPFRATPPEERLVTALREYRRAGTALLARLGYREQTVGRFVFSLLTKRLLSSPYALARTWWAHIEGYATHVGTEEAEVALERAGHLVADDDEKARREEDAVRQGGGVLARLEQELAAARDDVSAALTALGWGREVVEHPLDPEDPEPAQTYPPDGKWDGVRAWVDERLRDGRVLRDDERALVFTEYKDTLDYVLSRLQADGLTLPQVRSLFGGSSTATRTEVREAFIDPADPIRLLVATDVAAEGLNLQTTCRYVVHYEVPWNPMRLDQRNGRVDRHGQARDVTAFHLASDSDEDVAFLDYVVRKVDQVLDDLGSVGEVIDRALEERFTDGQVTEAELERRIEHTIEHAAQRRDLARGSDEEAEQRALEAMGATQRALRVDPARVERLLRTAVRLERGDLEDAGAGTFRLKAPTGWERLVDTSLRLERGAGAGSVPRLAFDPERLMQPVGERSVFRERADTRLIRLAHPLMRRAAGELRRRLWEPRGLARFTVGAADVPGPTLVVPALLTLVNELREPLHAELVELAVDRDGRVTEARADDLRPLAPDAVDAWTEWLEDEWDALEPHVRVALAAAEREHEQAARKLLPRLAREEAARQTKLFSARLTELDADRSKGHERLQRDLDRLEADVNQLTFDPELRHRREEELRRARTRLEAEEYRQVEERRERLRRRIERERTNLLEDILPRRHALARCTLAPVALALVVPEGARP